MIFWIYYDILWYITTCKIFTITEIHREFFTNPGPISGPEMDPPSYPIFTILCEAWAARIWILDSLEKSWTIPRQNCWHMSSGQNYVLNWMPCTNEGRPLSVVRISVFPEVSQIGYRHRGVPYRLWMFCATSERPRRSKDQISITIILSVTHMLKTIRNGVKPARFLAPVTWISMMSMLILSLPKWTNGRDTSMCRPKSGYMRVKTPWSFSATPFSSIHLLAESKFSTW